VDEYHISEARFRQICQATGWAIEWPTDYFRKPRPIYEVFDDLVEPQGYGLSLDLLDSVTTIVNKLRRCLPLDNIIVGRQTYQTATQLTSPYRPSSHYATVVLSNGSKEETIVYSGTYFLMRQIIRFGGQDRMAVMQSTGSFFDDNDEYNHFGFYLAVPAGIRAEQLKPFGYTDPKQPGDDDAFLYKVNYPAATKYFYTPYITANCILAKPGEEVGSIDVLMYDDRPDYYASCALTGQTLEEAVANDLKKDFQYYGSYKISDYRFLDYAKDKLGNELPRVAVHVQVEPFNAAALTVLDKKPQWRTVPDNVFSYYGLGIDVHTEPLGSVANSPKRA
jgi:hypothetical protein